MKRSTARILGRRRTTTQPELAERMQALVDRSTSRHTNSALLGVRADDGSINVRVAAGAAKPTDPYFIASITKMVTASIVMQLVDEQRLALSDRVIGLLPNLELDGLHRRDGTDHTGKLEVHHLLHQTSGLADYFAGDLEEEFRQNRDRSYEVADIVDIARTAEANFPPGDRSGRRSAYSDTNYQLLTAIIEAATDMTYGEAVDQRIATPLGLADTYVAGDEPPSTGKPPLTLSHKGDALDLPQALASERGAGGIVSSLDDQLLLSAAYHEGRLFDRCHTSEMRRWNRVFFPVDYGYGVMRYRLPRWMTGLQRVPEFIGHSGATNSFAFHVPELGFHVVGTLNDFDKPARAFKLLMKVAGVVGDTQAGQAPRATRQR